jgi:outer membrane receptor protein involved in Fe transport
VEFESIWAPTKRWDIVAGLDYTYISKQVKDPSLVEPLRTLLLTRRLGSTPEWKYAFWARYRFSDPGTLGWSAGLGLRGQTSSNARFSAQDKPEILKGFTVFDANVGYSFMAAHRRFDLSLGVTNLLDRLYITGIFAYAEPRTVSIRLSTKF